MLNFARRRFFACLVFIASSALAAGCAGTQQERLNNLASFDLSCPKEELQSQLISGNWAWIGAQVGVRGCGQQGRYILVEGTGWVLNSKSVVEDGETANADATPPAE